MPTVNPELEEFYNEVVGSGSEETKMRREAQPNYQEPDDSGLEELWANTLGSDQPMEGKPSLLQRIARTETPWARDPGTRPEGVITSSEQLDPSVPATQGLDIRQDTVFETAMMPFAAYTNISKSFSQGIIKAAGGKLSDTTVTLMATAAFALSEGLMAATMPLGAKGGIVGAGMRQGAKVADIAKRSRLYNKWIERSVRNVAQKDSRFMAEIGRTGASAEDMRTSIASLIARNGGEFQDEMMRTGRQMFPGKEFQDVQRMMTKGTGKPIKYPKPVEPPAAGVPGAEFGQRGAASMSPEAARGAEFGPGAVTGAAAPARVASKVPQVARPASSITPKTQLPAPTISDDVARMSGEDEAALRALTSEIPLPPAVKVGGPYDVTMPLSSTHVAGRYMLAELDDITHSFKNGYRELLQPRNRERLASEAKLLKMEGAWDSPRLGLSPTSERGTPIVTNDMQVMVGNGRVEVLNRLYKGTDKTKAVGYKDWLAGQAEEFGFTADDVATMRQPVLVRNVDDFDEGLTLRRFLDENNRPQELGAGVGEQAVSDARIFDKHRSLWKPAGTDIFNAENQPFLNKWIAEADNSELLRTAEGINKAEVLRRARTMILADMIGTKRMATIEDLVETAGEEGLGRVAQAMLRAAPALGKIQSLPLTLGDDLAKVIDDMLVMQRDKMDLSMLLGQQELIDVPARSAAQVELLNLMVDAPGSKKIQRVLESYAESAAKVDGSTGELFGGSADKAIRLQKALKDADLVAISDEVDAASRVYTRAKLDLENLRTANAPERAIADQAAKLQLAESRLERAEQISRITDEALERVGDSQHVKQGDQMALNFGVTGKVPRTVGAAAARDFVDPAISNAADDMVLMSREAVERGQTEFAKDAGRFDSPVQGIAEEAKQFRGVVEGVSAGSIPSRLKDGLVRMAAHLHELKPATWRSWLRPADVVMREMGLGAVNEMFHVSKEALQMELVKMSERLITIYKKAGITRHSDKSRAVFKVLDGKASQADFMMLGKEGGEAVKEIRTVLGELGERFGVPKKRMISDYITHVIRRGNPTLVEPELLTAMKFAPGVKSPYVELSRYGASGYVEDVVTAMDSYVRAGFKNLYLSRPAKELTDILKAGGKKMPSSTRMYLDDFLSYQVGARHTIEERFGLLVQGMASFGNMLADLVPGQAIKAGFKRRMGELINAPSYVAYRQGTEWLRGNVFVGALGLAADSALTNLTQGVNTFAEFGTRVFLRGYREMSAAKLGSKEVKALLKESGIITEARWKMALETAPVEVRQALGDKMMWMFEQAEQINRGSAFMGVYRGAMEGTLGNTVAHSLGLKAGIRATHAEAMAAGKKAALITQFNYMSTGTPLAFQHPLGKMVGQLGSFPLRQLEFLSGFQVAKRIAKGDLLHHDVQRMVRYVAATAIVTTGAERIGLSVRDNLWPVVPDPSRPLGYTGGFAKFGVGPIPQMALALGGLSRGNAQAWRDLQRSLPMLVPGGRAAARAIREGRQGSSLAVMAGVAEPDY